MVEYVAYLTLSPVGGREEDEEVKVFQPGDTVTKNDLGLEDDEWQRYIRKGRVVEKGSADDPSGFAYEPGLVANNSQVGEALRLNAESNRTDENMKDFDDEAAREQTAVGLSSDRTTLIETELAIQSGEAFENEASGTQDESKTSTSESSEKEKAQPQSTPVQTAAGEKKVTGGSGGAGSTTSTAGASSKSDATK